MKRNFNAQCTGCRTDSEDFSFVRMSINQYQAYLSGHGLFGEELAEEVGASLHAANALTVRIRGRFIGFRYIEAPDSKATNPSAILEVKTLQFIQRLQLDLTTAIGQTLVRKLDMVMPNRELEIEIWDLPVGADPHSAATQQCLSVKQGHRWVSDYDTGEHGCAIDENEHEAKSGLEYVRTPDLERFVCRSLAWHVVIAERISARFASDSGCADEQAPEPACDEAYRTPHIVTNVRSGTTSVEGCHSSTCHDCSAFDPSDPLGLNAE